MINFIIYENDNKWQQYYKNCILKIIGHTNIKYNILIIKKYDKSIKENIKKLLGKKIYLLNLEVPGKPGLEFAKEIRYNYEDWYSPIIIITPYEKYKDKKDTSKILILNFIIKKEKFEEEIINTIKIALNINKTQNSFNFIYNNEYYQIPYENIFYFEKNLNNNYVTIITKTKNYKIKDSIKNLSQKFKNIPFLFKTHQSCIINLKNVKKINFTKSIIYFSNCKITLLSREIKKELKELLEKNKLYEYL